jgi:serine/threonine protein phosphatase PrpC
MHNDVVVLATDGLWDNVFEKDVVNIVQRNYSNMQKAADDLSKFAESVQTKK